MTRSGRIALGVIADDFTGATDIADVLVDRGFRTVVVPFDLENGPRSVVVSDADAVVLALKSRTAPVELAVEASRRALDLLRKMGCERFYFKYCSTFDSTSAGNIGPVIDALMEALDVPAVVVTPANPRNGRTVYQAHLFVGDVLLDRSGMENHPLTPMRDADLRRLLGPQTRARVEWIPLAVLRTGGLRAELAKRAGAAGESRIAIIVDGIDESDLETITSATKSWPLLSGSAGLAQGLSGPHAENARRRMSARGRSAVLCGSAARASRAQLDWASRRYPTIMIDAARAVDDPKSEIDRIRVWARMQPETIPAIIGAPAAGSSASDDLPAAGSAIEEVIAGVAAALVADGFTRMLVAGGETSGAVVERLDLTTLEVGPSIAEGVVWTHATDSRGRALALALKSGNFGDEELFESAWEALDANR